MAASASFPNLDGFRVKEYLEADPKWVRYLLTRNDEQVILEFKKPATIKKNQIEGVLSLINYSSANDVHFTGFILHEGYRNDCKVAYPAETSLVETYKMHKRVPLKETYTDYATITTKFNYPSVKWIYNILGGKTDLDRVLLTDSDPRNGFVLVQSIDWDGSDLKELSYTAFAMRRNLKSIRNLTNVELPLLRNIERQCIKAIAQKHQILERFIQARFDYHPVFWHLQVHFYLGFSDDNSEYKLANVIKNLEKNTWHYMTTVLKIECKLPKLIAILPEFKREDEQKAKRRFNDWKTQKNGGQKNWRNSETSTPGTSNSGR